MNRNRFFPFAPLFTTVLTVLLVGLFASQSAFGQAETGLIGGIVKDPSGAVVAGATVTIKNTATSAERTVQSGTDGGYSIPELLPGIYDVTVTTSNFQPYRTHVEVTVGSHVTLDAQLSLTSQAETVEVVAAGGTAVNTQSQELSQVINTEQMEQLPSLTRNPYDFVGISGNVSSGDRTPLDNGDQNTTGRGVNFAINGQREAGTEVLLDGVENLDLWGASYGEQVPIDSVQEFSVLVSNYDVQYGRASGGIVNLTTKSGTNSLHGSAWEFNRLSAYTANTYANDAAGAPKGGYTRNQFGYTIGGPIVKNRLFFFDSTEWLRVRSDALNQAYVPTPQFLALTAPNVQAYFNAYGKNSFTFAKTITQAQTGTITGIPASTPILGLVNYAVPADAGGSNPQNTYRILGRLDFNMNSNTQMFFRYGQEVYDQFVGSNFASVYPLYDVGKNQYNRSALYSLSHIFSPNLLSTSKISFSRIIIADSFNTAALSVPELFLKSGATVGGINVQFPGLWSQFAGTGGEPYGGPQNEIQLNQDLAWTKGRHSMHFGGEYNYIQFNKSYGAYGQGIEELGASNTVGFNNMVTGNLVLFEAAINPQGKYPCFRNPTTGTIIQTPSCTITLPVTEPVFARSYRYSDWSLYAGDSFRLTSKLTLNYGTRYEHYGVQHNNHQNLDSNFYYGAGSSSLSRTDNYFETVRTGSAQIAPNSPVGGLWAPSWGTIAPRVGFAYDIFGDGKTSIRGGYGMTYERNFGNVTFNVLFNPPAFAVLQLTTGATPNPVVTTNNFGPLGGSTGSSSFPPPSARHVNQNIGTAYTQFYDLSLQREVTKQTVVSLDYSGAHGVHLYDIAASNPNGGGKFYLGDNIAGGKFSGVFTRPNLEFGGINTRGSNGASLYDSLTVHFQTQNIANSGLSLVANYTWSHARDDLSSTFSDGTGGGSDGIGNLGYLDPADAKLDWGSSDFDIRHRIVISPIWSTPWFKSGTGIERQALGGYTFVGIFSAHTGTPYSVYDTTNSLNAGSGYGIPRYVPLTPISSYKPGPATLIGENDFQILSLPKANETVFDSQLGISDFGPYPSNMTGRNAFEGPGAWNLDIALTKSFAITERIKAEFRAEGFNIFNHHNLYINAGNFDGANFPGQTIVIDALKGGLGNSAIGGNHDERRFGQFALKLSF